MTEAEEDKGSTLLIRAVSALGWGEGMREKRWQGPGGYLLGGAFWGPVEEMIGRWQRVGRRAVGDQEGEGWQVASLTTGLPRAP